MNSIHRIGLTVAGIVTTLVVAGAFVVDGYTSAIAHNQPATDAPTQDPGTPSLTDTTGPMIIYVRPTPTQTAPDQAAQVLPAAQATNPPTPDPTAAPPVITQPPRGDDNGGDD